MSAVTIEELQRDELAMSVARAVALANETAASHGTDPATSLVTITEETTVGGRCWQVHYGPRDYVKRRGGDLYVTIDEKTAAVSRVVRGQ